MIMGSGGIKPACVHNRAFMAANSAISASSLGGSSTGGIKANVPPSSGMSTFMTERRRSIDDAISAQKAVRGGAS
jgi:hypothetical protein